MSAIVEAAARAKEQDPELVEVAIEAAHAAHHEGYSFDSVAVAVLAAVTPLIEANALERAAKMLDEYTHCYPDPFVSVHLAAAVRAMNRVLNLEISRGLSHD